MVFVNEKSCHNDKFLTFISYKKVIILNKFTGNSKYITSLTYILQNPSLFGLKIFQSCLEH